MKAVLLALLTAAALPSAASAANPLTRAEKRVCQTLEHCVSIIERHPHDSYDYAVLTDEFARYGRRGQAELLRILDRNVEARTHAADLLALSSSPSLIAQLSIMTTSSDAALGVLARRTIRAVARNLPDDASLPPQARLGLIATAEAEPSLPVLQQLLRFPHADIKSVLPSQIRSDDPEIIALAFRALHADDPAQAMAELRTVVSETTDLNRAMALSEVIAGLGGAYDKILSQAARDPALSLAMQIGASYGLLRLTNDDAPTAAHPDLANRLVSIDAVLRTQGQLLPLRRVDAQTRLRFAALTGASQISADLSTSKCTVGQTLDPAARIGRLPFFETGVTLDHRRPSAEFSLPAHSRIDRGLLRSALSLAGGWLAGYADGQSGSLIWYANADNTPTLLSGGRTAAIFPKIAQPMGRLPLRAWAVSTLPGGVTELLSIEVAKPGAAPMIRRHAALPAEPDRYARLPDDSLLMVLPGQTPVQIAPNGRIRRGCSAETQAPPTSTPSLAGGQTESESQ